MSAFVIIGCFFLLGVLLRLLRRLPEQTPDFLNRYVIAIALPALVLHHVPSLELNTQALYPFGFAWALLLLTAALVLILARLLNWNREITCALLIMSALGNTSFVGFPLVQALLGTEALGYAILYDQLGSFLGLTVYATIVLALMAGVKTSAVTVLWRIVSFPPFLALCAGLLLGQTETAPWLESAFKLIGATLIPAVMVAVGWQWRLRLSANYRRPLLWGLGLKCLLMPALAWAGVQLFALPPLLSQTIVLEAGMAPMISAGALLMNHRIAEPLVAATVGYGLLLCFITVPAWYWLIS